MRKDLQSFYAHDKDYGEYFDLEKSRKVADKYREEKLFETAGFKKAVEKIPVGIRTHIDIGSGTGWLTMNTAPKFEKVIGIEPSKKAVEIAKTILHENRIENVVFLEDDMVDGLSSLNVTEPVFITTATVLSHIKDYYVKAFLEIVNDLPKGSALFFQEPYEKNIQQNLWHIRSKEWWAENLNKWDISFFEIYNSGYAKGIFGLALGEKNQLNIHKKDLKEETLWILDGLTNKFKGLIRKISRWVK